MHDARLIERWLPIAALGEESVRERRSMTALPPTYYLHVWWARRPLVASRAAVLASLLPADADREKFLHVLGIQWESREGSTGNRHRQEKWGKLGALNPYGYKRAFTYQPGPKRLLSGLQETTNGVLADRTILDPDSWRRQHSF